MQMSTAQQEALEEMLSILVDRLKLNAETLLTEMRMNRIISDETYDALRKRQVHQSDSAVVIDCIRHIKIAEMTQDRNAADGSAWKFFIEFLQLHDCSNVANQLEARAVAIESMKDEPSSKRVRADVRPDAAATSSCNISQDPTPFACVQRLQKYLVDDYLKRLSTLTVFPSNDQFGKFEIDATYVALKMVRLHPTTHSTVMEMKHMRYQQDVPGLISETSTLLEQLLSRGRSHEAPPQPMLIMGDPGQGKTTFAQKLTYDWAMTQQGAASATPLLKEITLLLAFPLRNLMGKYEEIVDFLLSPKLFGNDNSNIIGSLEVVKNWIRDNRMKVVVLLDGLDEMNLRDCTQLNEVLSKSWPTSPDVPLIITTRPYAIPKECPWPLRFEICHLTPTQASEIIEKYFSTRTPENVRRRVIDYCLADENSFLQSSPLLLHLLCGTVFRTFLVGTASDVPEIQLPRSQTKCYFAIVRWLYERVRETTKEKLENFSLETWIEGDLVRKLCELAFERTFSKSEDRERLVFDRHEVDAKLGQLTEDAMRTGYLVADSLYYGCYDTVSTNFKLSFAHKTFQEFFAAVEIVRKLEKHEDIERLIGDDVKSLREILLFAIGVACETKSRIVDELFDFALKLIRSKLRTVLDKYDDAEATFVLSFLKTLFRETTNEDQRKSLKQFAKQNSAEFERFGVSHFHQRSPSRPSSFFEIAEGLFPLHAGFRAFEAVDVSRRHFVFNRRADKEGESIVVVEITAEVAGISKAQVKEIQANHLYFEGTESGLSIFLSTIGVRSNMASLNIIRSPLKLPTHLTTRSLEGDALKSEKSSFNVITELCLSSQLDAREVRNVFEYLWMTRAPPDKEGVKIENLWFNNFEKATQESGDVRPTATNVDDLPACHEPITNSVKTLFVRRFSAEEISSRWLSAFAVILTCVREIDGIRIDDYGMALIDKFEKEPNERRLERRVATIHGIECDDERSLPSGSLAKFVADVKAKKLMIFFNSSSVIFIKSFVDFCKILAEEENSRRAMLQEMTMLIFRKVQPLIPAIVDSLVGLLRSLRDLQLNFFFRPTDEEEIEFDLSSFPAELLNRVRSRNLKRIDLQWKLR